MGMSPCCEKTGLKKGPWTPEEDQKLVAFIEKHGHGSWRALPAKAGLRRCGKSCRLRWTNYLRPGIKRGKFSLQEEQTIIQLHALLGNRWSAIASHLPKRTDNEIKNYWNTHLKKRLEKMGIDPTTHKLKIESLVHSKDGSNLSHMAQWETARLEAEARLTRESKLQEQQNNLGSTSYPATPQITRLVLNKITPQQHLSLSPCLDVLKAWQSSWSNKHDNDNNEDNDNNKYLLLNKKKTMHMHSMYAMMLATDDNLESPTSTLCFPVQMINNSKNNNKNNNNDDNSNNNNNSNAELVSTNHVGLMNESYLLPPTTVDGFINKGLGTKGNEGGIIATLNNGGGDSETWRYLTKHNTEEVVVETDDKEIMYDTMMMMVPCLHNDNDGDIMVAVEALRGAGYYGNNNNNDDVVGFDNGFDSNDDLTVENLQVNFEENKDYWNGMLSYK